LLRKQLDSLVLPLMDHRSLWLRVDGGGKSKYRRTDNFCPHASMGDRELLYLGAPYRDLAVFRSNSFNTIRYI